MVEKEIHLECQNLIQWANNNRCINNSLYGMDKIININLLQLLVNFFANSKMSSRLMNKFIVNSSAYKTRWRLLVNFPIDIKVILKLLN
jgi:hypothetical protein